MSALFKCYQGRPNFACLHQRVRLEQWIHAQVVTRFPANRFYQDLLHMRAGSVPFVFAFYACLVGDVSTTLSSARPKQLLQPFSLETSVF